MKKSFIGVLAMAMVLCSGMAMASEGVEMEAGIKAWYNTWKNSDPNGETTKFDASFMVGPAFEAMFPNHLYAEASYLLSATDYEKDQNGTNITADRKDLDIAVGYQFIHEAGVFVGYKDSNIDWDVAGETGSIELSGPVIGLRGNYAINEMFGIYGNAAYLFTRAETEEGGLTEKHDAPGTVFELGVKATFSEQISATLGYKMESTKEDETNVKDDFAGITLGAMYKF
jgi:hypothetical protein